MDHEREMVDCFYSSPENLKDLDEGFNVLSASYVEVWDCLRLLDAAIHGDKPSQEHVFWSLARIERRYRHLIKIKASEEASQMADF